MTRQFKVSFFAFLFSLLLFLPLAAHGRLAVHHIHRPLHPHNQYIHRQVNAAALLSGVGSDLSGVVASSGKCPPLYSVSFPECHFLTRSGRVLVTTIH